MSQGEIVQDIQFNYRHDFAVWAGARASQRGFTTVKLLRDAIEHSKVKEFSRNPEIVTTREEFDELHLDWCEGICEFLESQNVKGVTFGRAAKLVAVYLKAMVVIPQTCSIQAEFIHPPIDRILLRNLSKIDSIPAEHRRIYRDANWTNFSRESYLTVLDAIRLFLDGKPLWQIEEHWSVTAEK